MPLYIEGTEGLIDGIMEYALSYEFFALMSCEIGE